MSQPKAKGLNIMDTQTSTVSKTEILNSIKCYVEDNKRPCPAKYLVREYGDDITELLTQMKKVGEIIGKRGRNGGIVIPDGASVVPVIENAPVTVCEASEGIVVEVVEVPVLKSIEEILAEAAKLQSDTVVTDAEAESEVQDQSIAQEDVTDVSSFTDYPPVDFPTDEEFALDQLAADDVDFDSLA